MLTVVLQVRGRWLFIGTVECSSFLLSYCGTGLCWGVLRCGGRKIGPLTSILIRISNENGIPFDTLIFENITGLRHVTTMEQAVNFRVRMDFTDSTHCSKMIKGFSFLAAFALDLNTVAPNQNLLRRSWQVICTIMKMMLADGQCQDDKLNIKNAFLSLSPLRLSASSTRLFQKCRLICADIFIPYHTILRTSRGTSSALGRSLSCEPFTVHTNCSFIFQSIITFEHQIQHYELLFWLVRCCPSCRPV
jgi:hypothetical protein